MSYFGWLAVVVAVQLLLAGCAVSVGPSGRWMNWSAADGFCIDVRAGVVGGSMGHCSEPEPEIVVEVPE